MPVYLVNNRQSLSVIISLSINTMLSVSTMLFALAVEHLVIETAYVGVLFLRAWPFLLVIMLSFIFFTCIYTYTFETSNNEYSGVVTLRNYLLIL